MKSFYQYIPATGLTFTLLVVFVLFSDKLSGNKTPNIVSNSASLFSISSSNNTPCAEETNKETFIAPQRIHPVRISGDITFADEAVPLKNLEVRERFDRELMVNTFWHSNTMLSYKLAEKYFETIEPILKRNGVPDDFKYLAVAESGLRHVVSPAGAAGYWQFLSATGKQYKLEITTEVDERYDLEKSTEAACKYLKDAKKKFGNWTLAAASYNVGMGRIENRLKEQKVDNYYDLYLNEETSRYIFRILAFKMLFENPKEFGFNINKEDLYENYAFKKVEVTQTIPDLAQYAVDNNTNYKMLKYMNPWLRDTKLTVAPGKSYTLKIALEN
jgi:hypothetical protein